MVDPRRGIRRTLRVVWIAGFVAAITYAGFPLLSVNAATESLAYLLLVLLVATFWGLWESILASVLSVFCLNYFFLPPLGQFVINDPQNWVTLFAFLVTAILVSKLSDTSRVQTQTALDRQQELERLYSLSRSILLTEPAASVTDEILRQVAQVFDLSAVSLYVRSTDSIQRFGTHDLTDWDDRLREVALQGTQIHDSEKELYVTAIRLGSDPIASLAIQGGQFSDSALQSTTNLIAIALERARALETVSRADIARRSEELKSTLLDAIAHEFKTPLTSIRIAATALLSESSGASSSEKELASIIDEESLRLQRMVTDAIRMARIDAGRVQLQMEPQVISVLLEKVLANAGSPLSNRLVIREIAPALPLISGDGELLQISLRQLLDNAVKYSPEGSPLTVLASTEEGRVILRIRNQGPGIPENEQAMIFERFYRGPVSSARTTGTGMGLAIVREIVQAHHGQVSVQSTPGQGTEFCMTLPALEQEPA